MKQKASTVSKQGNQGGFTEEEHNVALAGYALSPIMRKVLETNPRSVAVFMPRLFHSWATAEEGTTGQAESTVERTYTNKYAKSAKLPNGVKAEAGTRRVKLYNVQTARCGSLAQVFADKLMNTSLSQLIYHAEVKIVHGVTSVYIWLKPNATIDDVRRIILK